MKKLFCRLLPLYLQQSKSLRRFIIMPLLGVVLLTACGDEKQKAAEQMLERANALFADQQYNQALLLIDSLRKAYPEVIETRKQALRLHQDISLKQAQEELTHVDSTLLAVKQQYEQLRQKVEKDKQDLRATPEELTLLTRTRIHRDSLQTRFDVLCAKIRYIHKKQKEQ